MDWKKKLSNLPAWQLIPATMRLYLFIYLMSFCVFLSVKGCYCSILFLVGYLSGRDNICYAKPEGSCGSSSRKLRGKKSSSMGCCVGICTCSSTVSPLAVLINSLQVTRLCSLQPVNTPDAGFPKPPLNLLEYKQLHCKTSLHAQG